ncbi:MAG: hypothetical protein MZW92_36050 [Comamonadaceae bacterium]|nr:hypothetical protein [Comamonadaceae bacterium]
MKALLGRGLRRGVRRLRRAARARPRRFPGRKEAAANIHIGIDWLASVSFGHVTSIGKRVIVLGGGNTGDGLLPLGAAPGRRGREGDRALAASRR